jgi:hypothetical protein
MSRRGLSQAQSPNERFEKQVDKESTDCWLWKGSLSAGRYASFMVNGRNVRVHRWVYERDVGPIPEGMQIDHMCGVTRCVNPAHLRPLTPGDNCRAYYHEQRATCANGHPRLPENLVWREGGKRQRCRICSREIQRRYRQKHGYKRSEAQKLRRRK